MRKLGRFEKRFTDGELHVILPEHMTDETGPAEDRARIKEATKKEASKPLLLLRAEQVV